ncbi:MULTISPECIES: hypothetical protein [Methylobacter]
MKSYQIQTPKTDDETVARITRVVHELYAKGHVIISASLGDPLTITVKPAAATRLLKSVCTGQGGAAGQMYRSYAADVEGVQVVWHKPMRTPSVMVGPGHRRQKRYH